jgi:hypothetical protein
LRKAGESNICVSVGEEGNRHASPKFIIKALGRLMQLLVLLTPSKGGFFLDTDFLQRRPYCPEIPQGTELAMERYHFGSSPESQRATSSAPCCSACSTLRQSALELTLKQLVFIRGEYTQ